MRLSHDPIHPLVVEATAVYEEGVVVGGGGACGGYCGKSPFA